MLRSANRWSHLAPKPSRRRLQASGGNRREAAKALGISYKVLLRRLRKLGMDSSRKLVRVS